MQPKSLVTSATMWITVVIVGVNMCHGQSYWKKSYGGDEVIRAIQPTDDDNFLMVGDREGRDLVPLVMKVKPDGDTIWTKSYGNVFSGSWFCSVEPSGDGNFMLVGCSVTIGGLIVKIKPSGDTIWTKKKYKDIEFQAIQPCSDGNFLIVGNSLIMKINSDGDTIWTKTYRGSYYDIQPTNDGNFLLAGVIYLPNDGPLKGSGLVVKIKPNGDTIWTKTYYRLGDDLFGSIQPLSDGNFMIAGWNDSWLIKIKSNGDTIWTKTYNRIRVNAIQPTFDDNFLLVGTDLMKIKPNGDTVWTKTFGTGEFYTIQPTNDGNFLVAGGKGISIHCLIADQYAYNDSLFTYKIPTYTTDTLNFGYAPLKVPSGMTVSPGGTVSWTPKTDSVYMDHAEFLVLNDMGRKDTLTFNIFVNSDYHVSALRRPPHISKIASNLFDIAATSYPGHVKFSFPPSTASLCIYDITGRIVDKITPAPSYAGTSIVWPGDQSSRSKIHAGKYFVKATMRKSSAVKSFVLVR